MKKFTDFENYCKAFESLVKKINKIAVKRYGSEYFDLSEFDLDCCELDGVSFGLGFENEICVNASVLRNRSIEEIAYAVIKCADMAKQGINFLGKELYFNLSGGLIEVRDKR